MTLKLSNKQIKRIAKQIKGQTPTLEELDETFEQDEASAQFQKAEEIAQEAFYAILDVYGPQNQNKAMGIARDIFQRIADPF